MNPFDRMIPSRPWIDELGVAIELDIGGRRRKVVVTRAALDGALGSAPPNVEAASRDRAWLGTVQHNVDVIRDAATRKLEFARQLDDPILLGPEDITGRQ